jgi:hypothetical protein
MLKYPKIAVWVVNEQLVRNPFKMEAAKKMKDSNDDSTAV